MVTRVKYSLNITSKKNTITDEKYKHHRNVSDDSINAGLICWTMCYFVFIACLTRLGGGESVPIVKGRKFLKQVVRSSS